MKVMMAGPIEWWWDDRWDTWEHWWYAAWRDTLQDVLVQSGHLTYRPDMAIKGAWDPDFQEINDAAIEKSDLVVNMKPLWIEGLVCRGTDDEMIFAADRNVPVYAAGPPPFEEARDRYIPGKREAAKKQFVEHLDLVREQAPSMFVNSAYVKAMLWPYAEEVADRISAWWEGGEALEPSSERC